MAMARKKAEKDPPKLQWLLEEIKNEDPELSYTSLELLLKRIEGFDVLKIKVDKYIEDNGVEPPVTGFSANLNFLANKAASYTGLFTTNQPIAEEIQKIVNWVLDQNEKKPGDPEKAFISEGVQKLQLVYLDMKDKHIKSGRVHVMLKATLKFYDSCPLEPVSDDKPEQPPQGVYRKIAQSFPSFGRK